MSELFMECVEEELEPWQKQLPQVHLIDDDDDDDDEPIFVGVLSNTEKDRKPNPAPPQRNSAGKQETARPLPPPPPPPPPQPAAGPAPIMLPLSVPVTTVTTATTNLATLAPQPVIVNNQGFIVTSPQLTNRNELIASLGAQYPPGTSFTIVPAGQQQLFQQVSPAMGISGVVHRPQVQQIRNNVVTLSNVQSPTVYAVQSNLPKRTNTQSLQTVSGPVKENSNNNDKISLKRGSTSQVVDSVAKKVKIDVAPAKVTVKVENGILKRKCPKCHEELFTEEGQKIHMVKCRVNPPPANVSTNKLIMLVADFYYGRFEGDAQKKEAVKTNTTFKCQSCLKVLKNNIRFMNHMKHHLELEKQNSESWESHTTCQHCYRQYMTPFQLQCHIESAHSPIESSTNCKICELAFESEQVLLEHMKGNHKPGEMPYVCQVCSYRSSFFSDVETHFRSVHENTKDLLCPFCLKVVRTSHIYMQHYMKHQRKGIHRCGKCRLNFLTCKEKVEHRTRVHKTFRKPKALEGLPPGTKVTIRASLIGKTSTTPILPDRSTVTVGPELPSFSRFKVKPSVNVSKSKPNNSGAEKVKMIQRKKQQHPLSKHNVALKSLSVNGGSFTCIECNAKVDQFFTHFPVISSCGACSYQTSCKTSIGNHMIRFHSNVPRYKLMRTEQKKNVSASKYRFTLVCLNCDLLVDGLGGDLMTKHLADEPNHICKVIQEKDNKDEARDKECLQQPTIVQLLMSAPAARKEGTSMMRTETITSGSIAVASVDQPELERKGPAWEQDKDSIKSSATVCSLKSLLLPAPSSSCTSDDVLDLCSEPVGDSESLQVEEQLLVSTGRSENDSEHEQNKHMVHE